MSDRMTGFSTLIGRALALPLLVTLCSADLACRTAVPVVDRGEQPAIAEGTLSGTVGGPEGTSPIVGRTVNAIEINTGQRYTVKTSTTGGFSFKVPPGTYRLEVELIPGESILRQPDQTKIDRSDVDAQRDFVITTGAPKPPASL